MEETKMMSISKVLYGIIAIVVAVLIIATVLIPTINGLELTGDNADTYMTLLGVICTLAIIVPVMRAVRMISGGKD